MKRSLKLAMVVALTVCRVSAQESKIGVNIAPILGFNVSMGTLHPSDRSTEFQTIMGTASTKDVYLGIGLQAHLLREWQATFRVAYTLAGSAFCFKASPPDPITGHQMTSAGRSSFASTVTHYSFTAERVVARTTLLRRRGEPRWEIDFNAGVGLAYSSLLRVNLSDTPVRLPGGSLVGKLEGFEHQSKKGAAAYQLGLNTQIVHKERKLLKLGVWYQYTPRPAIEYHLTAQAYNYGEDNFRLLVTPHQFLLFAEFPIRLVTFRY